MKMLRNILLVVVVLVVCVGNAFGDLVYTTGTSGAGTIDSFAGQAGDYGCTYTTMDFTLDGEFVDDVWAIILSEIGGETYFNGYGYSFDFGPELRGFEFVVFGDSANPYVSASQIIPIVNDDDPLLFGINLGELILGYGDDVVLSQGSLSINGGAFGDISEIVFDYSNRGDHSLDSVAIITPPVTLVSPGDGSTGIDPNSSLVWDGDVGYVYDLHLWDNEGGPEMVFTGLTNESLDVNDYLEWDTTYFWYVDGTPGGGGSTVSTLPWSFTTGDYECQGGPIEGDIDGNCIVDLVDFAKMANNWLVERNKVLK